MVVKIRRHWFTNDTTIGVMIVDGITEGFTLEDTARPNGVKIPRITAIPAGEYIIVMDNSPHFNRIMPHILNVPAFEGVRIHCGNGADDTEGCILVGTERTADHVWNSKTMFERIRDKMISAADKDETISLSITNEQL